MTTYRIFVGVLSTVTNYAARQAARLSWMRYAPFLVRRAAVRFFVATMHDRPEEMKRVKREAEEHGDIVISSFAEHYDNLGLKTLEICRFGVRNIRYVVSSLRLFLFLFLLSSLSLSLSLSLFHIYPLPLSTFTTTTSPLSLSLSLSLSIYLSLSPITYLI